MGVSTKQLVTRPENLSLPGLHVIPWIYCANDHGRLLQYSTNPGVALHTGLTCSNDDSCGTNIAVGFNIRGLGTTNGVSTYINKFELIVHDNSTFQAETNSFQKKSMVGLCSSIMPLVSSSVTAEGAHWGIGGKCSRVEDITPLTTYWTISNEKTPTGIMFDTNDTCDKFTNIKFINGTTYLTLTQSVYWIDTCDFVLFRRIRDKSKDYDVMCLDINLKLWIMHGNKQFYWILNENLYDDDGSTGAIKDWGSAAHVLYIPLRQSVFHLAKGTIGVKYL